MTKIYCVKCKQKPETNDDKMVTTKNDRIAVTGTCNVCGSKNLWFLNLNKI